MSDDVGAIGFKVETSDIDRGGVALENFAAKGDQVDKAVAGIEGAVKRAGKSLDTLGQSAQGAAKVADVGEGAKKAADGIGSMGDAVTRGVQGLKSYIESLSLAGKAAKAAAQQQAEFVQSMNAGSFAENERKQIQALVDKATQLRMTAGEYQRYTMAQQGMSAEAQKLGGALADHIEKLKQTGDAAKGASTGMNLLQSVAGRVVAAFSVWKVADLIVDMTKLAARYETMGVVMEVAGRNAGYSRGQMDAYAASLQKSGISMMESRNVLTQLATAHIDLARASELGRAAQDLAVVANVNSSEALARVVQGIKSGQTEILRTMGLNVNFEQSYKDLAKTLGKTTEQLTEKEKVLARTNATTKEAKAYTDLYEAAMGTAGKQMTSLTRYWDDFKTVAGDAFLPLLAEGVKNLTISLKAANNTLKSMGVGEMTNEEKINKLLEQRIRIRNSLNHANSSIWDLLNHPITPDTTSIDRLLIGSNAYFDAQKQYDDLGTQIIQLRGTEDARKILAEKQNKKQQEADAATTLQKAREDFLNQFATDNEKLSKEVEKWKAALGNSFTPADEQKIRYRFAKKDRGEGRMDSLLGQDDDRLTKLQAEREQLEASDGAVEKLTQGQLDLAVVQQHLAEGTDLYGKALTSQTRAQLELHEAKLNEIVDGELYNGMLKDEVAAREAAKKAAESWLSSIQQSNENLQAQVDAHGKSTLAIEQEKLARMQAAQVMGTEIKIGKEMVSVTGEMTEAQKQHVALMQQLELQAWHDSLDKEIFAAKTQLELGNEELKLIGLTGVERAKIVALRKVEFEYAKKVHDLDAQLKNGAIDQAEYNARKIEINEWKQIKSSAAINKVIQDDFQKTADQINQSLTDALLRGFEGGKGFAKNFADTLKNMFKTMVLRPIISFIVQPIGNLVSGVISGMLGGNAGGGGFGNLLGMGSNAYSAYGAVTGQNSMLGGVWDWASGLFGGGAAAATSPMYVGGTVGQLAGSMPLPAFTGGVPAYGTLPVAGSQLTFSGAPATYGATPAVTPGAVGGWASSGMAAAGTIAIPLIVGMLAEMFDNDYTRHWGAASTSDYLPGVKPGGTRFDLTTGQLPDRDAIIAAINASADKFNTGPLGTGQQVAYLTAADLEGVNDRTLAAYLDNGMNMGRWSGALDLGDLAQSVRDYSRTFGVDDYYRGAGYVDPESRGWWGDFDHDPSLNDPRMIEASRQAALGIQKPIEGVLRALGQSADDLQTEFGFAYESGKHNSWYGHLNIKHGDEVLQDFGTVHDQDYSTHWKNQDEMFKAMYGAALDTFKNLDLPDYAGTLVDAAKQQLGKLSGDDVAGQAAALYQQASANIAATYTAIKQLIDIFPEFSGASQDAVYAVGQLMGGLQNLQGVFAQYVQNYYGASERMGIGLNQMRAQFDALGVAMPGSLAALRDLVNAQDLTTESGQQLFAQLLNISGGFADMMGQLREALGLTQDSVRGIFTSVLQEAKSAQEAQQLGAQKAGDLFVDAITNAMLGSVMDTVMSGLLDPLVLQMTEGAAQAAAMNAASAAESAAMNVAGASAAAEVMAVGGTASAQALAIGAEMGAAAMAEGGAVSAQEMAMGAAEVAVGGSMAGSQVAEGGSVAANNLLAGSSAAAQGLAAVVNQAVATINSMTAIFSSADFRAAYGDFTSAIGQISGALFTGVGSIKSSVGYVGSYSAAVADSGKAAQSAADQVSSAWRQIADSLMDEVRRIRGLVAEGGDQSLAYWQAQFAIATAAARAGDQDAAKSLTGLSGSVLGAAALEAGSMLDLQRIRAQLAASIQETADMEYALTGSAASAASAVAQQASAASAGGMQMMGIGNGGSGGYLPPAAATPAPPLLAAPQNNALQERLDQLIEENRQLRDEQRRQAAAMLDQQAQMVRLLRKWDALGLPPPEEEEATA
ncbi:MAG: hypothetical protein LBI48_11480 [Burkholderiaceae bacterium]|jgi:hypothetical protein|nr:hypothetical protein [Burkholderiaceae bacterium]